MSRIIKFQLLVVGATMMMMWSMVASAAQTSKGPVTIDQSDVPLTIAAAGSYILVSNLVVTAPNVTAIVIDADGVTLNLNGFTISGPGKTVGTGFGIDGGPSQNNVTVFNGTVRFFGGVGISLSGNNNRVENVRVESTGQDGIFVGHASVVRGCQVLGSAAGINTDDGSIVADNTIYNVQHIGIQTSGDAPGPPGGVTVTGNSCRLTGIAIRVKGQGNVIQGNILTQNGTAIDLSPGSANLYAKNVLQGNIVAFDGESDDISGDSIDPCAANIVLP